MFQWTTWGQFDSIFSNISHEKNLLQKLLRVELASRIPYGGILDVFNFSAQEGGEIVLLLLPLVGQ